MIIDVLTHLKDYAGMLPSLEPVISFLDGHDLQALEEGRYELGAENHFVNVRTVRPKNMEDVVLESHKKMIDIQIPVSGDEVMGYSPLTDVQPAPYNEAKDVSHHEGRAESFFAVKKGMFALFLPQDAHAPGVTPVALKKAIFKIPVPDDGKQQQD